MTQRIHKRFFFFLKLLEIRLRFVLILVITALVVGYWDHIQNYIERWQRGRAPAAQRHEHAAAETEYFCPMHPFVVREAVGKCPICGMDLVKRKRGATEKLPPQTIARVQASPDRIMQAGIQVEPVAYRLLVNQVRTYGTIEPDETRVARITARFPGRIDKLMVNAVGMSVKKGEPLARIYSPRFMAAAQEYIQAVNAERQANSGAAGADEKRRASQLTDYARQRLKLAGFTDEQLNEIRRSGKISENVTLYSPLAGTVLEKKAVEGDVVEESSDLYTIADLSRVWVQVSIIESDLAAIKAQMPVEISTVAFPNEIFYGTVDFVYPTVTQESRSAKVRVVIDNAAAKLKPGMYVTAIMRSPVGNFGPVKDEATTKTADRAASQSRVKFPTATQEEADRFLNSLAPGAMYYQCPMHAEVVSDKPADCPKCGMHLEMKHKAEAPKKTDPRQPSTERWVEGYSCAMHPDELRDRPGVCTICNCGMPLEKVRIERVPSIPESAVIDTGARKIVYVEVMPGVYDSRAVQLGHRTEGFYPVVEGLALGDRVVSRGSFLIDAEARLNPSATNAATTATAAPVHQH